MRLYGDGLCSGGEGGGGGCAVEPRYLSYIATLNNGEQTFGIITAESANTLTIKGLDAAEQQILRTNIKSLESTNRSLMPLGFESAVNKQELADLIAYIKQPGD